MIRPNTSQIMQYCIELRDNGDALQQFYLYSGAAEIITTTVVNTDVIAGVNKVLSPCFYRSHSNFAALWVRAERLALNHLLPYSTIRTYTHL